MVVCGWHRLCDGWNQWWRELWQSLPSFWLLLPLLLLVLVPCMLCFMARSSRSHPHEEYPYQERYYEEPSQRKSLDYGVSYVAEDQYRIPASRPAPHTLPGHWGDSLRGMNTPLHVDPIQRVMLPPTSAQPRTHSQRDMTWQPDVRSGLLPLPAVPSMSSDRRPFAPASMRSLSADSVYVANSRAVPSLRSLPTAGLSDHYSLPRGTALQPGARPPQTFPLQGPPVTMPTLQSARFPTH